MISLMWKINKHTDKENRSVVTRGKEEGRMKGVRGTCTVRDTN